MGLFDMFKKEEPKKVQKVEHVSRTVAYSASGKWSIFQNDDSFEIMEQNGNISTALRTPKGNKVITSYRQLADRIIADLEKYGYNYRIPESILSWHFTMIDNFSKMEKGQIVSILKRDFLNKIDWTIDNDVDDYNWNKAFRPNLFSYCDLQEWLSRLTQMQLTAATCIGNAYKSINVAFSFARILDDHSASTTSDLDFIASVIEANVPGVSKQDVLHDFETFKMYYGFHRSSNLTKSGIHFDFSLPDEEQKKKEEEAKQQKLVKDEDDYGAAVLAIVENGNNMMPVSIKMEDKVTPAYRYIAMLENNDYKEAAILLGQYYLKLGNKESAKKYFKNAAKAGLAEGAWELSGLIGHNRVPNLLIANDRAWVNYVLAAAEGGCPDAMNEAGNIYNRLNDYYLSAYWYGLAELYEHPDAVNGCLGIAKKWNEAGRPENNTSYRSKVGSLFIRTDCPNKEERHAALSRIYELAEATETKEYALFMAKLFERGEKLGEAAEMYALAGKSDDPQAVRCLADMVMFGNGIDKNVSIAVKMFRNAATQGEKKACFVMGEFERNAGHRNQAATWYIKAFVRGYEPAMMRLCQMVGKKYDIPNENNEIDDTVEDINVLDVADAFVQMYLDYDFETFEPYLLENAVWTSSYSDAKYSGKDKIREYYIKKLESLKTHNTKLINAKYLKFADEIMTVNNVTTVDNKGNEQEGCTVNIPQPSSGICVVLTQVIDREKGKESSDALFHIEFDDNNYVKSVAVLNDIFIKKGNYEVLHNEDFGGVWPDGIPKYKFGDILTGRKLFEYGMNNVINILEKDGYEILHMSEEVPHLVARKDNMIYGIYVSADGYPNEPLLTPEIAQVMKEYASKTGYKPMFAPISFGASDPDRFEAGLLLKFDDHLVKFEGLEEIIKN